MTSENSSGNNNQIGSKSETSNEIPQLPPPDPNSNLPTIKLGETITFEEWGPIILNTDGSTRKIANWDNLSEKEKEVTWRRISKRNEERRQVLLQQQQQQQQQQGEETSKDEKSEENENEL